MGSREWHFPRMRTPVRTCTFGCACARACAHLAQLAHRRAHPAQPLAVQPDGRHLHATVRTSYALLKCALRMRTSYATYTPGWGQSWGRGPGAAPSGARAPRPAPRRAPPSAPCRAGWRAAGWPLDTKRGVKRQPCTLCTRGAVSMRICVLGATGHRGTVEQLPRATGGGNKDEAAHHWSGCSGTGELSLPSRNRRPDADSLCPKLLFLVARGARLGGVGGRVPQKTADFGNTESAESAP